MFKKLSNSLLSPKEVSKYYGESFGKSLLFMLVLLFFIMIPSCLSLIINDPLNAEARKQIKKIFSNEEIPFIIEDGALKHIEGNTDYVYTNKGMETIYVVVTENIDNATAPLNGMAIVLAKDGVYLNVAVAGEKLFDYNKYEYLKNLDLSDNSIYTNINFWDSIFSIVDSILDEMKPTYVIANTIYYIFYWTWMIIFFALILTVFAKFKTGSYLKFFNIFKVTIYNLTPFIICIVFATLFNLTLLLYLGYILSGIYSIITINETLKRLYLTRNEGE